MAEQVESKVTAIGANTEPTVEDVRRWVLMMGERGLYNRKTARFRSTALKELVKRLGEEEPKTARWLLENIADVAKRWGTFNDANPATIKAYESRARTALADFLAFQQDPAQFKGRRREPGASRPKPPAPRAEAKQTANTEPPPEEVPPKAEPATAPPTFRSFPISTGEFVFQLPPGSTVRDIRKIAFHLLAFATDFDPGMGNIFSSLAKTDQ